MNKTLGVIALGIVLFIHGYSFAAPWYPPATFAQRAPDAKTVIVNEPGDTNDAYAAVAEWGDSYALSALQGTHSNVKAIAQYQYGFTLSGANAVEININYNYNLMAELYSINQTVASARAVIGIYAYRTLDDKVMAAQPVWEDYILFQTGGAKL